MKTEFGKKVGKMPPMPKQFGMTPSQRAELIRAQREKKKREAARKAAEQKKARIEAAEKAARIAAEREAARVAEIRKKNTRKQLKKMLLGLTMIALAIFIVVATLPINAELWILAYSRDLMLQDSYDKGWTDYIDEHWESNVQSLERLDQSSVYGHFMVNAPDWLQIGAGLLEALLIIFLAVVGWWILREGFDSIRFFEA